MKKKLRTLLITTCIVGLVTLLGCAAFQDVLTPARYSPVVESYVDANDVPLPLFEPLLPWHTLFDLRVLDRRMDFIHQYRGMSEGLRYNFAKSTNQFFITASESLQAKLFSPEGPLGVLLPVLFTGPLALLAGGRYIKSPHEKELERKERNGDNGSNSKI